MVIEKIGRVKRPENLLKRDKKMKHCMRFGLNTATEPEPLCVECNRINNQSINNRRAELKPIIVNGNPLPSTTKDDLAELTKSLVRKERDALLRFLMQDPIPSDLILDLIASRVKEINAILRS